MKHYNFIRQKQSFKPNVLIEIKRVTTKKLKVPNNIAFNYGKQSHQNYKEKLTSLPSEWEILTIYQTQLDQADKKKKKKAKRLNHEGSARRPH